MIGKKLAFVAMAGGLLWLCALSASASVLTFTNLPAGSGSQPLSGSSGTLSGYTVLATYSSPIDITFSGGSGLAVGTQIGTLVSAEVQVTPGTEIFVYQVQTSSNYPNTQSVALNGYPSPMFSTSAAYGYLGGTLPASFIQPSSLTGGTASSAVNYGSGNVTFFASIGSGATNSQDYMVAVTSGTVATLATDLFQDGYQAAAVGLAPAVPEPAMTSALAGLGLMGGVGLLWRRRKR
jgi:LPXTG-motif cell wall-anchored protein